MHLRRLAAFVPGILANVIEGAISKHGLGRKEEGEFGQQLAARPFFGGVLHVQLLSDVAVKLNNMFGSRSLFSSTDQ